MRIADHIAKALEAEGVRTCSWGDGILVDVCRPLVKMKNDHPLNVMTAACDAMERAPDLFEKFMMRGHDARCRQRVVRAFRLLTPPRSEHQPTRHKSAPQEGKV